MYFSRSLSIIVLCCGGFLGGLTDDCYFTFRLSSKFVVRSDSIMISGESTASVSYTRLKGFSFVLIHGVV